MRNLKLAFLALLLSLVISTPAFALQCKAGNDRSDECWTTAQLTTNDYAVITGTILVYDFTTPTQQGNDADDAAFFVRVATSADQSGIVAGVAQKNYSSGDRVQLLVRGQGQLRVGSSTYNSGDRLYVQGTTGAHRGQAVVNSGRTLDGTHIASNDKVVAYALESGTSAATADAYIVVV